jgi:hypothetical protein
MYPAKQNKNRTIFQNIKIMECTPYFNEPLCWDVSRVTSMFRMFTFAYKFNQDISFWNVSSLVTMDAMFQGGNYDMEFNQDISSWDVSSVLGMSEAFRNTKTFNQDISSWDVSKVCNFGLTFYKANAFNQDISSWNVSSALCMNGMFQKANSFNQSLCDWSHKSPSLTHVSNMFIGATSCPYQTAPVIKSGTPDNPHQGPYCFACT